MLNSRQRPNVDAERYRELHAIAMSIILQLPHHDIGECLIIRDLCDDIIKRWMQDERLARHRPHDAMAEHVNQRNVVRLMPSE